MSNSLYVWCVFPFRADGANADQKQTITMEPHRAAIYATFMVEARRKECSYARKRTSFDFSVQENPFAT